LTPQKISNVTDTYIKNANVNHYIQTLTKSEWEAMIINGSWHSTMTHNQS